MTPSEELATAVRRWVAERVRGAGTEAPADLYPELLRCIEPALLDEVMRRVQGNRWVAARWLSLNRATVRKKLGVYDLTDAHRGPNADGPNDRGREAKRSCTEAVRRASRPEVILVPRFTLATAASGRTTRTRLSSSRSPRCGMMVS
jgi:Fis family transcriptional regulator